VLSTYASNEVVRELSGRSYIQCSVPEQ